MRHLFVLGALFLALPAHAVTIINNGLAPPNTANVIDDDAYAGSVYVRNVGCPPDWPAGLPGDPCSSPGDPTEVEVAAGASLGGLSVHDSSMITISGGYMVGGVSASDNSAITITDGVMGHFIARGTATITMSGGYAQFDGSRAYGDSTVTMTGGGSEDFVAYDSSTFTMTGGGLAYNLVAYDSSNVTMSGGSAEWLNAYDSSTVTMSGGELTSGWLSATGSSTVAISGGRVASHVDSAGNSSVTISGGLIGEGLVEMGYIAAGQSSLIRIIGTGFAVDGSPMPYGDLTALSGIVTGTLASGDSLELEFFRGIDSTITLSAPTECSDFVDNDGDGLIDYPDDPGCFNPLWFTESPQCQDGINNDFNTGIDFDGGESVWGVAVDQPDPQCVGTPWKNKEATNTCGLGAEQALLLPPLIWLWRRRPPARKLPHHPVSS